MKRYLVITGGLGNQLFQLAGAMSSTNDQINVVSCLGQPRLFNGELEISRLDLSGRAAFLKCNKRHYLSTRIYSLLLSSVTRRQYLHKNFLTRYLILALGSFVLSVHLKSFVWPRVSIDIGFDNDFKYRHGNIFIGYFQSFNQINQARDTLLNAFGKILPIDSIKDFDPPDLVIHSRLGDYRSEIHFGTLGSDYFSKALESVSYFINPKNIWLFSDEPELAITLIPEAYRDKLCVVGGSDDSPLKLIATMLKGKSFIISNSTFSWWSAFLSQSNIVIAPRPWFAEGKTPNLLIPETWIQINRQ